jgi:hypothetical protein
MKWVYLALLVIAAIAIWLAIEVIKWLFIVAIAVALVWVLLALRRRLAD